RRWLGSPGRVAQVMVHLAGQGALDQRLLKGQRCGIDGFGRHRAVTERLQQFWGNGRQRGRWGSWFAWHRHSLASCYASNTKLMTGPSSAASITSRTTLPLWPAVVAAQLMASRSQQSRAKVTRKGLPSSQRNSN